MESRSTVCLEVEKNDRKYTFYLPVGAPFGEAYDAAFDVLNKIREMSEQAVEKARRSEEDKSAE